MKRQEFIDALYAAGWEATGDAQWTMAAELHRKLFPSTAELEDERRELVEDAHQAGQTDAGVDPSYLNAQTYATNLGFE